MTAAAMAVFGALPVGANPPPQQAAPTGLNVEDRVAPLDITGTPYFGWLPQAPAGVSDDSQTAYEIQVNYGPGNGANTGNQIWDSGQVTSSAEAYVAYGGPTLADGTSYTWTVRTWDSAGTASPYAPLATFDTGINDSEWSGAQWIRRVTNGNDKEVNYSLYLKDIGLNESSSNVTRARVYIGCVECLWELHANGQVVDTQYDYGAPGELFYDGEDITSQAQAATSGTLPIGVKMASWPTTSNEGLSRPQGPVSTASTTNAASAAGASTLTIGYVAGYTPSETLAISVNSQFLTSSGSPTGGSFTITDPVWGTTAPIAYNASSATVASALNALSGASGAFSTSGGALPGTGVTITVSGTPLDHVLTVNGSGLTGGTSPSMSMTQPQTDTLNSVTTNESLAITGSPTGGTFVLSDPVWGVTGAIPYNATATQVQTALNAIASDGNSFAVAGGPLPATPVVITLQNAAAAGANLPPATTGNLGHIITVSTKSFTGGSSPNAALTSTDTLGFNAPLTAAYPSGTPIVSENGPDGLLAKVVINYADGTQQTVVTDPSWLVTKDTEQLTSTVTSASGQNAGIWVEYLDGRQLGLSGLSGWDQPGYTPNTSPSSATAWLPATSLGVAPLANPASCTSWDSGGSPCGLTHLNPEQSSLSYRIVHPVSVTTLADGTVEADFGNAGNYIPVVQFNSGTSGNLVKMYGSYRLDHSTLSVPSAVGASQIDVAAFSSSGVTSLSVGDPITVDAPADGYGAGNPESDTVTSITGSQSLTTSGTPTGGTITLTDPTWGTTAPIAYNASAATVAAALNALPGANGAFAAIGGALPTAVTIFDPAGSHVLTVAYSLTGGSSPKATIAAQSTSSQETLGLSTPLTLAHGMSQLLTPTGTGPAVPSAGTFELKDPTWGTTGTIPWNATSVQIAAALNALPGSGGNAFAVSCQEPVSAPLGCQSPGSAFVITPQNAALSGNHTLTTASVSLTGGSMSIGPTPVWVQGARIGTNTLDTQGANLSYQYTETAGAQTTDFSVSKGWRYLEIDNPGETLSPSQIWAVATSENAPVSNSLYSVAGGVTQDTAAGTGPAINTGDNATFTSSNTTLNNVFQLIERSNLYGGQMQWNDSPDRQDGQFLGDTVNQSFATTEGLDERSLTRQAIQEMVASQQRFWLGGTLACGSATAACLPHTAVIPPAGSGSSLGPPGGQFGIINAVWPANVARDIPDYTEMFPEWVWHYYQMTGDKATLQSAYAAMQNVNTYVLDSIPTAGIFTGLVYDLPGGNSASGTYPNLTESGGGSYTHGILDWGPAMRFNMPAPGTQTGGTSEALVDDRAVSVFQSDAQAAAVLGDTADATAYTNEANSLINAINSKMADVNGRYDDLEVGNSSAAPETGSLTNDGGISEQHAQAFAVTYGVAPQSKYGLLGNYIASQGMQAGAMDWAQLETSLNLTNQSNALVNLLTNPNTDGPAKILAEGGTTMWEVWDPGGCSYSPCYGSVISQTSNESFSHGWGTAGLYPILRGLLGLTITGAGASTIQIQPPGGSPLGGGLTNASGTEQTERGQVAINWAVNNSGQYTLTTGVPDNVAAQVNIPDPNDIPYTATGGGGVQSEGISIGSLQISGTPTGGTFTLTDPVWGTTAPIAYNASAATIAAALNALSGTGGNAFGAVGGPLPAAPVWVTLTDGAPVASHQLTVNAAGLTGGSSPAGAIWPVSYAMFSAGSSDPTTFTASTLTTTAMLSPSPVNGYYNQDPTVTLSATDVGGPGVASTMYQIDGGAWHTYSAPFQITGDGVHTLLYYSTDTTGSAESVNTMSVSVDTTPPTTAIAFTPTPVNGATPGAATVTLTPTDALSGVASTMYNVDGGGWQTYSGPFVITAPGRHTIQYYSTDVAGNVESTKSASIAVDSVQTTPQNVTGTVPATLGVSVVGSSSPSLGSFMPNTAQTYTTTMSTLVTTSAGNTSLTAVDASAPPTTASTGYLINNAVGGPYQLLSPLNIQATDGGANASTGYQVLTSGTPVGLLSYIAPVSNDPVVIGFKQSIGATDPLRTGNYTMSVTLTLSTTAP